MAKHWSIWTRRFVVPQPWRSIALILLAGVAFFISFSDGSLLMFVFGVWILAPELLKLLYWLADRQYRGRKARLARGQCGKCGYDLTGVPRSPNRRCPECGGWNP